MPEIMQITQEAGDFLNRHPGSSIFFQFIAEIERGERKAARLDMEILNMLLVFDVEALKNELDQEG